jgi:putative ATP-binding cassette transporter
VAPAFHSIELVGAAHAYEREGEEKSFTLGPMDLALRPGELVFMVGGNGSGKTTFAKLLTGLYTPESGEILLNGKPVDDLMREHYRQHFAVTFSEFYLFERLLGLDHIGLDERARVYLSELQLAHKVTVQNGQLSTTELSRGQRKRLALLTAYLEDRPIYVFDEWAADQDPQFKEIFYHHLLPELKARGKTALVISHDDRYFGVADRILKLEDGQLVADEVVVHPQAATA